jgi:hypothetical protein
MYVIIYVEVIKMRVKIKTPDGIIERKAKDKSYLESKQKFPMRIYKNKKAYDRKSNQKERNSWD